MGLSAISLFSGAGGLDLSAKWAGISTKCYVEWDRYAQAVLVSRMRDGGLDEGPIWDDVTTFDGKPWRGKVDIIFGGFPCQDLSVAGKRAGIIEGKRSGLWSEFARIIDEVRPRFVLVENVRGLLNGGHIGTVLGDLADLGYGCWYRILSASAVGAPHKRERVWIMADTKCFGSLQCEPNTRQGEEVSARASSFARCNDRTRGEQNWAVEPSVGRVVNGMAYRVDRIKCLGNGVVPQQALPFFEEVVKMSKDK